MPHGGRARLLARILLYPRLSRVLAGLLRPLDQDPGVHPIYGVRGLEINERGDALEHLPALGRQRVLQVLPRISA